MSPIIVDDEMEVQLRQHVGIQMTEGGEELLVAGLALRDHGSGGDIQGGNRTRSARDRERVQIQAYNVAHLLDKEGIARELLIIWLLQQAPIGSVNACHDRRFRRRSANSSPTLPRRKPANDISQLVVGPMDLLVRDAGMKKLMSW